VGGGASASASDLTPFQLSWLGSKAAHKVRAQQHYPQNGKNRVRLALVACVIQDSIALFIIGGLVF